MTVFVHNPLQYPSASVIIEVGIDIRKVYAVGIEETLKQQVVLQRVYLRDAKAVGHHGACSRATPWSNHHSQFLAGGLDEVRHDKEVARETHGLHYVKFEIDVLDDIL